MNTEQFVKESVAKIIGEMKLNREQNGVKEYGTLLDSLTHFIPNIHGTEFNQVYIYYIREELKKEEAEVSVMLKESLNKKMYKEYHRWTLIFDKLIKTINRLESEQNYYYHEPKKVKNKVTGKYIFVSTHEPKATHCAFMYFELTTNQMKILDNDKIIFEKTGDYQISTVTLNTHLGLSGRKGKVLCIDKNISFDDYINKIDPYVSRFEHTVLV